MLIDHMIIFVNETNRGPTAIFGKRPACHECSDSTRKTYDFSISYSS